MVQFRPAAERGQFDPPVVEDFSDAMTADSNRRINIFQRNLDQINKNAKMEIEEAKNPNNYKGLEALAQFSSSAQKYIEDNIKKTAQDIEDGENWNYLTGGRFGAEADVAEDLAMGIADARLDQVKADSLAVSGLSNDPNLGYRYYEQNAGIGKGLLNEKGLLQQAKSEYPSYLSSYKISNQLITLPDGRRMKANELFQSTDQALISAGYAQARYDFIKSRGLQYTTKKNFQKYLGETLYASEGAAANNTITQNIAKAQGDTIAAEQANLINNLYPGMIPEQISVELDNSVSNLYKGNTNLSMSQANTKAVEALKEAALLQANPEDGIQLIKSGLRALQIPGREGTEIGRSANASVLRQALTTLERNADRMSADRVKDIGNAALNQDFTGVDPEQAYATLQQARAQVLAVPNGGSNAQQYANKLDRKAQTMLTGANLKVNDAALKRNILAGVPYSDADLQYMLNNNLNSPEQIAWAKGKIKEEKLPNTTASHSYIKNAAGSYAGDLARATGLKENVAIDGTITFQGTSDLKGTNKDTLQGIAQNLKYRMEDLARDVWNSRPADESPEQKDAVVQRELKEWYQRNVKEETGAYNFEALKYVDWKRTRDYKNLKFLEDADTEKVIADADQQAAAYRAVRKLQFTTPGRLANIKQIQLRQDNMDVLAPVPWHDENDYVIGATPPPEMKAEFSIERGDTVMSLEATVQHLKEYSENKTYSPEFEATARELNVSPNALLTSQFLSYKKMDPAAMEKYNLGDLTQEINVKDLPVSGQLGQGGGDEQPLTPYEGAQLLMSPPFRYPSSGAAYLSGNIMTESLWIPNKPAWNDVGMPAGGLVSWRAERLEDLEARFGRKVQYISTYEQLKYMHEELQKPQYKEFYDIFMNPKSTQRELIYASKGFWGYGVVGDRYVHAEQILQQLNNE